MPAPTGRFALPAALPLLLAVLAVPELQAQEVEVTQAVVAADVEEREPVGVTERFAADVERVYFYTVLEGDFPESRFEHVWLFEGEERARVSLTAQGPRWRTWSSKAMLPQWTGEWTVRIVDADGQELASVSFQFGG
jgi:hypothetical protein